MPRRVFTEDDLDSDEEDLEPDDDLDGEEEEDASPLHSDLEDDEEDDDEDPWKDYDPEDETFD